MGSKRSAFLAVSFFISLSVIRAMGAPPPSPVRKWIEFTPRIAYSEDEGYNGKCEYQFRCHPIYLKLEFDDNQAMTKVYLSEAPYAFQGTATELTAEEKKNVVFHKDSFGRYWTKSLQWTGRMTVWALNHACAWTAPPPMAVKGIDNIPVTFTFDTTGLGEEVLEVPSDCRHITGKYKNKAETKMEAAIHLVQAKYEEKPKP